MKNLIIIIFISLMLIGIFISSCKKEDNLTKAIITVRELEDTTNLVPYAHVRLEKFDVQIEGMCDENGEFEHVFRDVAILDVRAWTIDSVGEEVKYGQTTIRLEEDKAVAKTVLIN
jgi:hypothetical protein